MGARVRLGLTLAVALTGCGASAPRDASPAPLPDAHDLDAGAGSPPPPSKPCQPTVPPMPRAFIGPDVKVRTVCGVAINAPVASVSEIGLGITSWSAAIEGDVAFSLPETAFKTCGGTGTTVATAQMVPPADAVPGDTYDAVVTVSADGDVFPPGKVALHGEIVAPQLAVDTTTVDFGEVPANQPAVRLIRFTYGSTGIVDIRPPKAPDVAPFVIVPSSTGSGEVTYEITLAAGAGTYSVAAAWSTLKDYLPAACFWTQTITFAANVVSADGGAGPADGSGTHD